MKRYLLRQLDEVDPTACPCGTARRAFMTDDNDLASVHVVDIKTEPTTHYHKKLTEIYVVLDGTGHIELDGEEIPLRPMTAVMIQPLCRHRAVGNLRILNIVIPKFDPADEWSPGSGTKI